MRHLTFPFLSLVLSSACAATPPARRPTVLARPVLAYEASFRGVERARATPAAPSEAAPEVDLEFRLLSLTRRAAAAFEGERVGPSAWTTRQAELPDFGPDEAEWLQAPRLLVHAGREQNVSVLNERAYVADFVLSGNGETLIVDPVVEVYATGLQVRLRAEAAGGRVTLDLDLTQCEELAPPSEREVRVPGLATSVALQVPELLSQRLKTAATLAPDECLVLSWNHGTGTERRLFALITAREHAALGTR